MFLVGEEVCWAAYAAAELKKEEQENRRLTPSYNRVDYTKAQYGWKY